MKEKTKICGSCKKVKTLDEFHRSKINKDGLYGYCKKCVNKRSRKWQKNNREYCNALKRKYYRSNPQAKKAHYGRGTIGKIINKYNHNYAFLVNCGAGSREEFIRHLTSTIPEGYSWKDYGTKQYENKLSVDHIKSCDKFNLLDKKEFWKCFNYKNLRLVLKKDNAKKYKF